MHEKLVHAGFRVHLQVYGRNIEGVNVRVLIKRGWFPVASSTASTVSKALCDAYRLAMPSSKDSSGAARSPESLE